MRRFLSPLLVSAVALFLACATAAAFAAPVRHLRPMRNFSPVRVYTCNPQPMAGFLPGTPGGPFFWRDVYGYRYMEPVALPNAALSIAYVNVTHRTMTSIDFGLIARGVLVAEVHDVGTFSPGAEIKHQFGVSPNVFPLRTAMPRCVALRATFQSGRNWVNPHLPKIQRSIYRR